MSARMDDYSLWADYVAGEIARYTEHAGSALIWRDTVARDRHMSRYRAFDDHEAAFTGPWHVVRKYVVSEFRQWVEEYEATERLTFSEWRDQQREARAHVAFIESADYTLGQLVELRRAWEERDALIREAAARGASKVAIADAIGISRQQVHSILARPEVIAPVTPIADYMTPDGSDVGWTRTANGGWEEVPF